MARSDITLTDSYQQISAVACTITVKAVPVTGLLFLNDVNSDTAATQDRPTPNDQITQDETKPTFAKGLGYILTVDETG